MVCKICNLQDDTQLLSASIFLLTIQVAQLPLLLLSSSICTSKFLFKFRMRLVVHLLYLKLSFSYTMSCDQDFWEQDIFKSIVYSPTKFNIVNLFRFCITRTTISKPENSLKDTITDKVCRYLSAQTQLSSGMHGVNLV